MHHKACVAAHITLVYADFMEHNMLTARSHATMPSPVQVQHARDGNAQWKLQPAGFGKRQSLLVESKKELRAGASLTMDFGVDKTDAQLLLDYGVLDSDSPKVSLLSWHLHMHWTGFACCKCGLSPDKWCRTQTMFLACIRCSALQCL